MDNISFAIPVSGALYNGSLNLLDKCGIFVYSNRRFDPNGIGVNLGCVDDIDTFEIEAKVADNINK